MRKVFALGLAAAMGISALTGCGSSEKPASTTAAATAAAGETKSEDTKETAAADDGQEKIRIGAIAPVTGDRAEAGQSVWRSFQIAAEDINAKGGVLGKQIEIVLEDSKGDAKEAVELTKKLADDKTICAVLGPMTSAEAIACAPVFDEYELVELAPVASNNQYATMSPYSFTLAGRQSAEMPYFVEKCLGGYCNAKSIGVIWVNDDWGVSSIESMKEACEQLGIEVTAAESFNAGEKDFTAVLTKIRQTNPEVLVLATQAAEGSLILNQVKAMGWEIPTVGVGAMYSDQVILLAGDMAEGLIAPSCFFLSEDDKPAWDYATRFSEEAGFYPTIHGPLSYDSVIVLAAAIEKAGSTDRNAIRDALTEVSGVEGLAGSYEFTEDGDIIRAYRVLKVQDGKWTAVTDYETASLTQ
jgi:branched-chain amino acid transport system substrate-binding protein